MVEAAGCWPPSRHHTRIRLQSPLPWSEGGISKARLREFWTTHGYGESEGPLRAWHAHVSHKSVARHSWADVKAVIGSASLVGRRRDSV